MKLKRFFIPTIGVATLLFACATRAQVIDTWIGGDGDFSGSTNWDLNAIPMAGEVALIDNGSTATISASSGTNDIGAIRLGDIQNGVESGHIIMNGGHLNLGATLGDPKAVIGFSANQSTFIMNGGTIFFDGPDLNPGNTGKPGVNELDWEVGEGGLGRFEMHHDAVFRASDDLKIAENAAGHGSCLIDGNAILSVGSGISISSGVLDPDNPVEQSMWIGGNALVEAGNSMGAGNPLGQSDEGYLTMAINGGLSRLTIQDNAVMNIRRLTARQGTSIITVRNHGQFHIFDVLNGKGFIDANTPPDRPVETGPNSTFASQSPSDGTLTLQDDALMTVNSDPATGPTKGLAISGPRDPGNDAGTARMIIRDRASFRVEQDLALGTGADVTSDGTLEVVGPNASVSIGGNLSLAVDLDGIVTPGRGTLMATITGTNHTTVNVDGIGRIANGHLAVKLDGYSPVGGETYTLIKAGSFDGQFVDTDFTAAPLTAGLSWQVQYTTDSVLLKVTGATSGPRVITVNTEDNTDFSTGKTNLFTAINSLQDGDVIKFDIPNTATNKHYIVTPPVIPGNGYPVITANNITIDGFSQPGSVPNTNPILATNNARYGIVLDSRDGGATSNEGPGFDPEETGVLFVMGTNCHIRGLCILGPGQEYPDGNAHYGICVGNTADHTQVSGCWVGVDLDGSSIYPFDNGVAQFGDNTSGATRFPKGTIIGVKAGPADTAGARAQFNVFCGSYIDVNLQGQDVRISGNFVNVLPDGLHDLDNTTYPLEALIEMGRGGNNLVIGTDGDGLNDAEERNVFGGVTEAGDDNIIELYGAGNDTTVARTNMIVAGNYIGVAVDGTTRFANSMNIFDSFGSGTAQFGSDFDGVSDDIEANVIFMNNPFDTLFPNPSLTLPPRFMGVDVGGRVSLRGNKLVNNYTAPVDPTQSAGDFLTNYYAKAIADVETSVIPVVSTNSSTSSLIGTVPMHNADYPVVSLDVYMADPEGITNGMAFVIPELPDGFIQGKTYFGTFTVDGSADLDFAPGAFKFDITSLNVPVGTQLTVTANYSKVPAGNPDGDVVTSLFSVPVSLKAGAQPLSIGSITQTGSNLTLNWSGGTPPYQVQRRSTLSGGSWVNEGAATSTTSATVSVSGNEGYFRVQGQ